MHVLKSNKEQITLKFGNQTLNGKPYNHTGIDMVKRTNSLDTIIAAQKGKVVGLVTNVKGRDLSKDYGNYVELEHGNKIRTKYCHLKYGSIKVKKGEIVEKGQEVGYMGDTGYTFGAHLHFQMKNNGKNIDPLPYLEDKKEIAPYSENTTSAQYTKGNYKVLVDVLNVRKEPTTSSPIVKYVDLTKDAKAQMSKLINYKANGYVKNMEFTALEVENKENESWARTPSGWVCIYNKDGVYCKRI